MIFCVLFFYVLWERLLSKPIVFSIIESPMHPKLSSLYEGLGYKELQFSSIRKAMSALKKYQPIAITAEFFYKYGTNYSSNHISNLDSLLITLQKYPDYHPKLIIFVNKQEQQFVTKLEIYCPMDYVLVQPVNAEQVRACLI